MGQIIFNFYRGLSSIGNWLGLLGLRIILAWEFWEAGVGKLHGSNWFESIHEDFPFPFHLLPTAFSWFLATWTEILGAIGLLAGLGTRFWAFALIILDIVAWVAVHGGNGYNVCDNGYKLPLLYLIMLIPLVLCGAGKLSIDHIFASNRMNK